MSFLKEIFNDSLIKNTIYLISTQFLNLILGFFFWIIAARGYSPNEIGIASALISSMFLIVLISTLGFPTTLQYFLPRENQNARIIINSCIITCIIASLIISLIFIIGLDIWAQPLKSIVIDIKVAPAFVLITTASTVSGLIGGAFIAGRRASFQLAKETLFGFVKILPLHFFLGFGAMGIFFSWGIGLMFSSLLGFILLPFVWKGYLPIPRFDPIINKMAYFSIGNYLVSIFSTLPRLALPVIIVNVGSPESTGFFFIAMTVAGILYAIPASLSSSLLTESSERGEFRDKIFKAIKFNFVLLFSGLIFFILFGKYVLNLFNPAYGENASTTLVILALTSIPLSVNTIFTVIRNVQKRISSIMIFNAVIAIITLALSVPFLRIYGIEGAAMAYLVANTFAAIVAIYIMKNNLSIGTC